MNKISNKTVAHRRYYMNRVLKLMKVNVNTNTREIKLPYERFDKIPVGLRFYIGQCIKLQYNVQYELF